MDAQLERILKLIKKIGEKVVVIKDDDEFVITSLDEYMRLIKDHGQLGQLSETQMLDKINRDIALWRQAQQENLSQSTAEDAGIIEQLNIKSGQQLEEDAVRYTPIDYQVQAEIDHLNEQIQAAYKQRLEAQDVNLDYVSQSFNVDDNAQPAPKIEAKKAERGVSYEVPVSSTSARSKADKTPSADKASFSGQNQDNKIKQPSGFKFNSSLTAKNTKPKLKTNKTKSQTKASRINNFGYPNPEDTPLSEGQLNQQPSVDRRQREDIPYPLEGEDG